MQEKQKQMQEKIFESLFVNIKCANKAVLCGVVYRSPRNDAKSNELFLQILNECPTKIDSKLLCFIMGDFNNDLLSNAINHNFKDQFVELCLITLFYLLLTILPE